MGTKLNRYKALLLLTALAVTPAAQAANEPLLPLMLNGRYTIAWSGIPLGRINLTASETENAYRMVIDTKTKGVGALVSGDSREIFAEGTKTDAHTYIPVRYISRPQHNDEVNTVTLMYDATGNIATRTRENDDDPAWRPPVPFKEVNTARDPITASFMLRRMLYEAPVGKLEVSNRTYDGMRLANMSMIRAGNARVEIMGDYVDTVRVGIKRAPINGYTPKELKKYNKGDPTIELYFTNNAAFLPVRATAKTAIGELSMTLTSTVESK